VGLDKGQLPFHKGKFGLCRRRVLAGELELLDPDAQPGAAATQDLGLTPER
jgi:hypothetical protein